MNSTSYSAIRYKPKFASERWVNTQLGSSVAVQDVKEITKEVNEILKMNPTEQELKEAIEIMKRDGGSDRGLTVLSLVRSFVMNPLYQYA